MKICFFFFTVALTVGFWSSGCSSGAKQVQGTYQVTGSSGVTANITYAPSGQGSTSYAVNQTLPWQDNFTAYETEGGYTGSYVSLIATNDLPNGSNNAASSVTVTILENGKVFQTGSTNGGGSSVTLLGYF